MTSIVDTVVLNKNTDDELVCSGYCHSRCKKAMFIILCVLSLGTLLLVMYWKPVWKVKLTKSRCPLVKADTVLLKDLYKTQFTSSVIVVHMTNGPCLVGPYMYMEGEISTPSSDVDDTTRLTERPV